MDSIKNFIQLTETFGTAGQPTADQFNNIKNAGYQHVINLALPNHPNAITNEGAIVTELGMNYMHIPVKFDAPSKEQVRLFCQILSTLKNEKVFIHCILNFRVSAFMYHYLSKIEQYNESDSRSPMFAHWEPDPVWEELLNWTAKDLRLTS